MILAVAALAVLLLGVAWAFRPALKRAERPVFFVESEVWPRSLAPVAAALDRWREAGRISSEDHDRFMTLLRDDAQTRP